MARNTVISGARELLFSPAITQHNKIHSNISIGERLTHLLSQNYFQTSIQQHFKVLLSIYTK